MKTLYAGIFFMLLSTAGWTQKEEMEETFKVIKSNLMASKENIKKYEWIETTTTFYKGEQKSKKQNQCYYGVDGKLYKVATGATQAPAKTPGGIRGKIAANKKEDMQEYIEKAVDKVQTYLPPDINKLQQIFSAGKTGIQVLEPGKKFKLDFPGYSQNGDLLSISLDKENKMILGVLVSTYIDKPDDKINFEIKYSNLPDGTQYPGETVLDVKPKEVKIVIQNEGFKKGAGH